MKNQSKQTALTAGTTAFALAMMLGVAAATAAPNHPSAETFSPTASSLATLEPGRNLDVKYHVGDSYTFVRGNQLYFRNGGHVTRINPRYSVHRQIQELKRAR
ncbi:MAG: hypothetical protein AAF638_01740, partial [Pseudomonadota bacterium]